MIRKTSLLIVTCAMLLMSAASLQAGQRGSSSFDDAARKLGRGATNVVFSPLEIFYSVHNVQKEEGEVAAISYGLVQGIGRTFARIGVGIYEVATFPVPQKPMIMPEFLARGGVISSVMEPNVKHQYPEPDDWEMPPDRRRHSHLSGN